jgi:NAD(P)-dependent dehydrogenase (short-subunit alcohol dehydrogenase family)
MADGRAGLTMAGMLEGQVALIYGAAGGIGQAVVQRYWLEGASIIAVDRSGARLEELGGTCEPREQQRFLLVEADCGRWEECRRVTEIGLEAFGRLDVLVSCIGIYDHAIALAEIDEDRLEAAFEECFRVNVGSMLFAVKAALPTLAANRGRVVLTSSVASYMTSGGGVLYTAAKHAVTGVVAQLAYELAPHIRVNGVAPGVAKTVMAGLESLAQQPKLSLLPGSENALPLLQVPDNAEYGGIYALLGSATESSVMTGTVVIADSGLLARGTASPNGGADLMRMVG